MTDKTLLKALDSLDKKLLSQNTSLELLICGAFAIQLLGFERGTYTLDVDTALAIESSVVLESIHDVGLELGLSSTWLNDQASTVSLPENLMKRAQKFERWKNINSFIINRIDLIKMKASAFSIRRELTAKDWEDLILLKPTHDEIEAAIQFIKEINSPPTGANATDIKNFKETIDDLRSLI